MAPESHVQVRTGRLVMVHVGRLATVDDIATLDARVFASLRRTGPGAVICADFRRATPLSPEISGIWARSMRSVNGSIARSGMLLDPLNTMFNLQLDRVVRCAGNPARRAFEDVEELVDWVAPGLTQREQRGLRSILAEPELLR
jgi:hypothetical protein